MMAKQYTIKLWYNMLVMRMHKKKLTMIYFLWHVLRIFYILLCLISLIKLITPLINKYYFSQENFITKYSDKLQVENVSLHWQGLSPSLVLHNINLAHMPHDQIEYVSKIFAVIDLWKSLFSLNMNLSNIVINDVTINIVGNIASNIAGTADAMPKMQDINNLQQFLKLIHYQNLNVSLENISVKNLIIKYQNVQHIFKLSNVKYSSLGGVDDLRFNVHAIDNEKMDASAIFLNYKDRLGRVVRANYNLKSDGKYPDFIAAGIQNKFKLQQLSGYLAVNYAWAENVSPTVQLFHDIAFKIGAGSLNGEVFDNFKGRLNISLNSLGNYTLKGVVDKAMFSNHVLQDIKYDFKTSLDDGDELRLQNLSLVAAKDLVTSLSVSKNIVAYFKDAMLGGLAYDLYVSGHNFTTSPIINVIRANITGLKLASSHNYPGVDSLDIKLKYLDGLGEAIVHSSNENRYVSITAPAIFKKILKVKAQDTHIHFNRQADLKWQILVPHTVWDYKGNNILGSISINNLGAENISFKGDFKAKNVDVLSLKELLTVKPLNTKLRAWLMDSVTAGVLADATLAIDLSDKSSFVFEGDFNNAALKFSGDWPELENIRGKIYLDNSRLEVSADKAMMKTQMFDSIKVDIADLHRPTVAVAINSKINMAKAKDIINFSPLHKTVGKYFHGAKVGGDAAMRLSFKLNHAMNFAPEATEGEVLLARNSIGWPKLNFYLTDAKGKLSFHDFDVTSYDMEASYHKDKVNLALTSGAKGLHVDMNGFLEAGEIAHEYLPADIARNIFGKASFSAALDVDGSNSLDGRLSVSTNGLGVKIDYPQPCLKQKNLQRPIIFKANFNNKEVDYALNIAPNVKFVAKNIFAKPIAAIDVYVDSLNINSWAKYFNHSSNSGIVNLNIFAKKLIFNKEIFANIKVGIANKDKKIIVSADARKIKGEFIYLANNEMQIDLDYLYLSRPFTAGFGSMSAAGNTYILSIKDLFLSDHSVKNIKAKIDGSKTNESKIKYLRFSYKNSDFDIKGDLDSGKFPKSTLEGRISSADFSKVFSYIPGLHNLNKGSGKIKFYITWPNTINRFTPKLSAAMFDVEIVDGMITDIGKQASKDLETSKALNFLSMTSIIKELSRKEEIDESYEFDKLEGNFIYSKGVLNTDKMTMKGDFGSAYVKGDINLKAYSYDLYMTVLPIITSSIPTIAALAGGVFAGALVWAANQLVENPISKIAMKVYKISGSIKNPKVVELDDDSLPIEAIAV